MMLSSDIFEWKFTDYYYYHYYYGTLGKCNPVVLTLNSWNPEVFLGKFGILGP